jgi:hypothetical protein
MTKTWRRLTRDRRDAARQAFEALSTLDDLAAGVWRPDADERHAGFSDLYAYVTDPQRPMSQALERALSVRPSLAMDLQRLLRKRASHHSPRLAAASSGPESSRRGTGFTISLRTSRAEPAQVYVVIDVLDLASRPPRTLFVSQPDDRLVKHALPGAEGGTIQLLADAESELVQALRDPESEVFLS